MNRSQHNSLRRKGKIIPNGVILKSHEISTVVFLTELGYDVKLIPKSNIAGVHTPDIKIGKTSWEMKSPIGEGNQLMENTIHRALRQSKYIIIDLRRTKQHQTKCIREINNAFNNLKSVKRILIITKNNKTVDLRK